MAGDIAIIKQRAKWYQAHIPEWNFPLNPDFPFEKVIFRSGGIVP